VFQRTQGFPLGLHCRFLRSQPTIAFGIQQSVGVCVVPGKEPRYPL